MKATTIIIAAALTLSLNVLYASNDNITAPVANTNTTITLTSLAPIVPMEATFEDAIDMTDFASLAPSTPHRDVLLMPNIACAMCQDNWMVYLCIRGWN